MPHPLTEALLDRAVLAARQSPNPARKVGAVLLPADGSAGVAACNTFPRGVQDTPQRKSGKGPMVWIEHAERNALYAAARAGIATEGATLATSAFPCVDCARGIVQSGVREVHTLPPNLSDPLWGESFIHARVVLEEGGVALFFSAQDPAAVHTRTMAAAEVPPAVPSAR